MRIEVRNMTEEDTYEVAKIHTESWQFAYRGIVPEDFLNSIDVNKRAENAARGIKELPTLIRIVGLIDGKISGFAIGLNNRFKNESSSEGEIWAMYVSPNKMSLGVGKALVNEFKKRLANNNFSTMCIWCLEDNLPSRMFYEKLGGQLSSIKKEIVIGGKPLQEVCYEYIFEGGLV